MLKFRVLTQSLNLLTVLAAPLCAADAATSAAPAAAPAVDPAYVWDLTPLFPDVAAWQAAKASLAGDIDRLGAFKGRLGESPAQLRAAFETADALRQRLVRLSVYASLSSDADTREPQALDRRQEIGLLANRLSQAASFMDPELIAVGETKIRQFLAAEPALAPFRLPILDTLRNAPHTLGAEAEGVLSLSGLVSGAPNSIYAILANADMPWPTLKLADGTAAKLDQSGYVKWRAVGNRADRQAVFETYWGKMKEYERTFGVTLFSKVKGDWFSAQARKYPSSLAATLAARNIPESVYRTLLAEADAALPTLHRYLKLRGRMLGISDLRYWDIYPPMVDLDKKFPIEDAKALVIEAVQPLGDEYVREITRSLRGRYTHMFPAPGKKSGAYMNGSVHGEHPYVLMNYNGSYANVSTLAHEWGHGQHSVLAHGHQPAPIAHYATFTAEIASTFNEALLLERMLKAAANDEEKLFYLGSALEELRGTFFRQAMFAEFELAIHETVEKGGSLSGQKLTQLYGEILRRYHGDAQGVMKIDDSVTCEWTAIHHFFAYDFYVYQYATSVAAAELFAERVINKEPGAVETYLGLLKAGGSDYPYELVKNAGVDLATPAPYRAVATRMNRIMDEMEAILAKTKK